MEVTYPCSTAKRPVYSIASFVCLLFASGVVFLRAGAALHMLPRWVVIGFSRYKHVVHSRV